jgi:hypothetical protein
MRRSSRLVAVAGAGASKPFTLKTSALKASARPSPAEAATLTVPKLKAELAELGLPTSGLKAVLLERLQAALGEPAAATAAASAAAGAAPTRKTAASKPPAAPTPKPSAAKRGPASPSAAAKRTKAAAAAGGGGGGGGGGAAEGATTRREEAAWARGVQLCIGCDEAGRGPLAGPVVAAACALPATAPRIPGVGESVRVRVRVRVAPGD